MKKLLFGFFIFALLIACNDKKEETTETPAPAAAAETKKTTDEILDMSETEGVKASLAAFANKDITGMTANYDDKVTMLWSNLDSLVGKQAVVDYYTNRFKIIDSLNFSEHILVPLKVNMQQSQYAPTGKWVLAWVFAHVKYTNGKKLNFWVHNVYHYNDGGKIDFVGQYLDRQPIAEATKGLVK
jgi:ketosteroid isomerase-like protein